MAATELGVQYTRPNPIKASKIIVVDDEDIIRVLLEEILLEEGYEVTAVSSGEEAVLILEDDHFDLIVSDMVMPGLSGIDVLQAAIRINPQQAVIMITGYPSVDMAIKLVNIGASDYITKPFNVDLIKVTVAKVLAQSKRAFQQKNPSQDDDSPAEDIPAIDGVTETYNFRLFNQLLENEVARSKLRSHTLSVLMAEIDGFENHTSKGGVTTADALMRRFADIVKNQVRPGDIVGRLGTAQLALLMPETDRADSEALANKVRSSSGWEFSMSGGIATSSRDASDARELLEMAQTAMQTAKSRGGDVIMLPK